MGARPRAKGQLNMINLLVMMQDDAKMLINEALTTPPDDYTGPITQETREIFETMSDLLVVQGLFKSPELSGSLYHMYTLYLENGTRPTIQDAITHLSITHPGQYVIGGAWNMDGEKFEGYMPHYNLIDFMPDVWNEDVPPTFSAATEVTDVNLLAGQSPRDFS